MSEVKVNKISPRTACGTVTVGDAGDSVTVTAGVPVTVNGDLKSNALKAVDGGSIISQCGTNITLGASGDTINLAAGASQTGFGRTGTVNWDTTAKTAGFTGVSGNGYFINTTSGTITVNLPASPSAGDIMAIKDYTGTFGSNPCTVGRNGSNIRNAASDIEFTLDNSGASFIYVDATEGWQYFVDGSDSDSQTPFIVATGGTVTCCGDYKIHTFTGPGTFTVSKIACCSANNEVSHLVVAGGGSGGVCGGGGGGAGGFRESKSPVDSYTSSPKEGGTAVTVTATAYPITVGAGGPGVSAPSQNGNSGSNSIFSTITSAGGGGGGSFGGGGSVEPGKEALTGGSGGGSGGVGPSSIISGAAGNTPPVSPSQGNNGGTGQHLGGCGMRSGGGGGATTVGGNGANQTPGPGSFVGGTGGTGTTTSITGAPLAYAGGGGGAGFGSSGASAGSPCGTGGTGGANGSSATVAGTTNRGGGGGGGAHPGGGPNGGSNGGSGIVIIRYKFQ